MFFLQRLHLYGCGSLSGCLFLHVYWSMESTKRKINSANGNFPSSAMPLNSLYIDMSRYHFQADSRECLRLRSLNLIIRLMRAALSEAVIIKHRDKAMINELNFTLIDFCWLWAGLGMSRKLFFSTQHLSATRYRFVMLFRNFQPAAMTSRKWPKPNINTQAEVQKMIMKSLHLLNKC